MEGMRRVETFLIMPFTDTLQWILLLSHTVKTPCHMVATTDAAAGDAQVRCTLDTHLRQLFFIFKKKGKIKCLTKCDRHFFLISPLFLFITQYSVVRQLPFLHNSFY